MVSLHYHWIFMVEALQTNINQEYVLERRKERKEKRKERRKKVKRLIDKPIIKQQFKSNFLPE